MSTEIEKRFDRCPHCQIINHAATIEFDRLTRERDEAIRAAKEIREAALREAAYIIEDAILSLIGEKP